MTETAEQQTPELSEEEKQTQLIDKTIANNFQTNNKALQVFQRPQVNFKDSQELRELIESGLRHYCQNMHSTLRGAVEYAVDHDSDKPVIAAVAPLSTAAALGLREALGAHETVYGILGNAWLNEKCFERSSLTESHKHLLSEGEILSEDFSSITPEEFATVLFLSGRRMYLAELSGKAIAEDEDSVWEECSPQNYMALEAMLEFLEGLSGSVIANFMSIVAHFGFSKAKDAYSEHLKLFDSVGFKNFSLVTYLRDLFCVDVELHSHGSTSDQGMVMHLYLSPMEVAVIDSPGGFASDIELSKSFLGTGLAYTRMSFPDMAFKLPGAINLMDAITTLSTTPEYQAKLQAHFQALYGAIFSTVPRFINATQGRTIKRVWVKKPSTSSYEDKSVHPLNNFTQAWRSLCKLLGLPTPKL